MHKNKYNIIINYDRIKPATSILLVDSDTEFSILMTKMLVSIGYDVSTVFSAEKAIEYVLSLQKKYDLIIIDINAGKSINAIECAKVILNEKDIPIVFSTSKDNSNCLERIENVLTYGFILKDNPSTVLINAIKVALKLHNYKSKIEEKHFHYQKIKDETDRILKHDLITPLNSIIGFSEYLLCSEDSGVSIHESLSLIKDSGLYMLRQIQNSLCMYKLEEQTYSLSLTTFSLDEIIVKVLKSFSNKYNNPMEIVILIEFNNSSDTIPELYFYTDKDLIYRLLSNLLKNAIEASKKSETVFLKVVYDTELTFRITNSGCIPETIRPYLFEKYVPSLKRNGNGLGTYSAKLISDTLGAEIGFHCDDQANTTTMYLNTHLKNI